MIRSLIDRLLGKPTAGRRRFGKREDIGPEVHGIDPQLVDERAVQVVTTLKRAGFEAYIVGGAVRDLLLGLRPKDFDVATNATPEQVRQLFRRAFIIGRRFRIVHVVFGRGREHEVIEVSTFRAYLETAQADTVSGNERTSRAELAGLSHAVDASGRVLRDNVWGPQEEDAARRDFTINAMYYDPETRIVVDYHKGLPDARKRLLRMIGDPATRYREDPVRIVRAVRFAAKLSGLGFTLEPRTAKPLAAMKGLLADVPQSRLFDEMLKLLQTGHALASVEQLRRLGLASGIYPLLDEVVARADEPFVRAALADTDRRVAEGKPVAPSFLLACVLWRDVHAGWQRRLAAGEHQHPALQAAVEEVFEARVGDVSGRGRLGADMREIWMMQPRFERRSGSGPFSLVEQPRFRAGFDFLRLRAEVGEVDLALADWWQEFSAVGPAEREDLLAQLRAERSRSSGKRVAARGARGAGADRQTAASLPPDAEPGTPDQAAAIEPGGPAGSGASDMPARKRRRRRRRGTGAGAAPTTDGAGRAGSGDGTG